MIQGISETDFQRGVALRMQCRPLPPRCSVSTFAGWLSEDFLQLKLHGSAPVGAPPPAGILSAETSAALGEAVRAADAVPKTVAGLRSEIAAAGARWRKIGIPLKNVAPYEQLDWEVEDWEQRIAAECEQKDCKDHGSRKERFARIRAAAARTARGVGLPCSWTVEPERSIWYKAFWQALPAYDHLRRLEDANVPRGTRDRGFDRASERDFTVGAHVYRPARPVAPEYEKLESDKPGETVFEAGQRRGRNARRAGLKRDARMPTPWLDGWDQESAARESATSHDGPSRARAKIARPTSEQLLGLLRLARSYAAVYMTPADVVHGDVSFARTVLTMPAGQGGVMSETRECYICRVTPPGAAITGYGLAVRNPTDASDVLTARGLAYRRALPKLTKGQRKSVGELLKRSGLALK
jgi:hypothetical protein